MGNEKDKIDRTVEFEKWKAELYEAQERMRIDALVAMTVRQPELKISADVSGFKSIGERMHRELEKQLLPQAWPPTEPACGPSKSCVQNVPRDPPDVWVSRDGRHTPVHDLDNAHLVNIVVLNRNQPSLGLNKRSVWKPKKSKEPQR